MDIVDRWGLLWESRPGLASALIASREQGRDGEPNQLTIDVALSSDFDPTRDYLVLEKHWIRERAHGDGKETWELELLAGTAPRWMVFPWAWKNWVDNERVMLSALTFILQHVPTARDDVQYAVKCDSKHNKARAWRNVSQLIEGALSRKLHKEVVLGQLAGHSFTAVQAMPHRIAQRMGNWVDGEWEPPIPRPEFEHPDKSGRSLLANHYGPYPREGPGVDHSTVDRPYMGGEEWKAGPRSF